jgi:hypothetical protein
MRERRSSGPPWEVAEVALFRPFVYLDAPNLRYDARVPDTKPPVVRPWVWRLWLVASLLFVLAAWQQPDKRAVYLSLAVVFGIIAARQRS